MTGRNIVVIGGSYVGAWAAEFAAAAMHTTHKVILVEKNTHFQHLFAFPRIAVIPHFEHMAFIPFTDRFLPNIPAGSASIVNAKVTEIQKDKVLLEDGNAIDYEYLVLATGTKLPQPASLETKSKKDGVSYFKNHQALVNQASNITIIGGGAVGVQLATDIKDVFPDKHVTLIHSRNQLMNAFHPGLHDIVIDRCNKLGIKTILGDRVVVPPSGYPNDPTSTFNVELTSGRKVPTNLAIICTGQQPLSDPLRLLSPNSLTEKGFIRVKPTLQIKDSRYPNIFALGDIADTGAQKAARPANSQARIVAKNIEKLASGSGEAEMETFSVDVPGIHLTLGLKNNVLFRNPQTPGEEPFIVFKDDGADDMNCGKLWQMKAPGITDYYL